MSDGGSKEKRRFPRFEVSIPVILRRKAGDLSLRSVDISRHGAFVRVDPPLPLRQLVQLRFRVPELGDVDAMCMVARSLGKDHPRGPGIGVDFFALSKDAKVIWERFVHKVRANDPTGGFAEGPLVTGVPLPQGAPVAPAVFAGLLAPPAPPPVPRPPPVVQTHPLFPTSPPMQVVPPPSVLPLPGQLPPRPVAEAAPAWFAPNSLTATLPFPAAQAPVTPMSAEVFAPVAITSNAVPGATTPRGPVTTMMQAISLAQAAPAAQPIPPRPLPALNTGVYRVSPQMQQQLQMVDAAQQQALAQAALPDLAQLPVPAPPVIPVDEEDVVSLGIDDGAVVMLRVNDREGLRAFVERDVARGGMFLKTPLVKAVGEKVALVVVHPDTDDEFHLDATVVRRVITGPMEQRGLGIFFRSLTPEKEAQLTEFIEGGIEVVELGTPISQRQLELEGAVAREPDSPESLEALGVFLLDEEGDLGGALTALTRALVLGPSVVSIHASLARAYRRIGDSVKVRAHERVAEALMLMQERMKVRLGVGED